MKRKIYENLVESIYLFSDKVEIENKKFDQKRENKSIAIVIFA